MTAITRRFTATVNLVGCLLLGSALAFTVSPAMAALGDTVVTPTVIPELPIEVETEVGPAGSLKQIPLFKEILELLEDPTGSIVCPPDDPLTIQHDESSECISTTQRRSFFNAVTGAEEDTMPDLLVYNPCFNVITGQPLRRKPGGEISFDQPGLLFDPDESVPVDPISLFPTELRTVIGALVSCPRPGGRDDRFRFGGPCDAEGDPEDPDFVPAPPDGSLVVTNPVGNGTRRQLGFGPRTGPGVGDIRIPPHRTVVAELSCNADGQLLDEDGMVVTELEQPVNEAHFFKEEEPDDPYAGRHAAEILGKALFWDMQIGSDSVQACGTCHFQSGVDVRTRNQLNPNQTAVVPDDTLQLFSNRVSPPPFPGHSNHDVVASDFPFHLLADTDLVGEPLLNSGNVVNDTNDTLSSMGVSALQDFVDVPIEGGPTGPAFGMPFMGVSSLLPDLGSDIEATPDPITSQTDNLENKLRRIEPRHTPTMHAAAFNFDNFWDGRARHDYNGGSVQGPSDPFFHIYVNCEDELRELAAPDEAEFEEDGLCDWTEAGGNYLGADEEEDPVPIRIRFSSLASQTQDPPLSQFEMSFRGRNWQKIGKKLLQAGVVPLANQRVAVDDSRMGPYSNQNTAEFCSTAEAIAAFGPPALGKPGLCISYPELIQMAFNEQLWSNDTQHLAGVAAVCTAPAALGVFTPASCDPFDGYVINIAANAAVATNTSQFTQMEANFSFFFGMSVQAYEQLLIPDDTAWDRFNDANDNNLGLAIGQPGEQGTIPIFSDNGFDGLPGTDDDIVGIREALTGSTTGDLVMVPGFGPDEVFGADIFMGGNMTAALPAGSPRNPLCTHPECDNPDVVDDASTLGVGSNPFIRTARCMLCHLGPEQTDNTNNVNAGLLQGGTEREFPYPNVGEPTGKLRLVTGFSLAEELEENAQDGVEVSNRDMAILDLLFDDPDTPLDESTFEDQVIGIASGIAFQDNGIYNIGIRPSDEDLMRGENDVFGWPKSLAALALKNLGGVDFEPCDSSADALAHPTGCAMTNFDPDVDVGGGLFEEVGEGFPFAGTTYEQESINPGFEMEPADPQLPAYLAPWANNLPAGEAHPQVDELAFVPNTLSPPPSPEYGEILFGADFHCVDYDPDEFGAEEPNFGWGPVCPNSQSAVPANSPHRQSAEPGFMELPLNGTWPWVNRVARNSAVKVPHLRNVELTGPYFHTGSYLTLRQVVDFYMRGGDFPITNAEDRDPDMVDIDVQAFGFGATIGLPLEFQDGVPDAVAAYGPMPDLDPQNCDPTLPRDGTEGLVLLVCSPEPATSTPDEAKIALVKFLLALTDERVAFNRPPFDQPEIFPPIDGRAPANSFGRSGLVTRSNVLREPSAPVVPVVTCLPGDDTQGLQDPFSGTCFLQVPETGASGRMVGPDGILGTADDVATRAKGFLGTLSVSTNSKLDHFDQVSEPGVAFPIP